MEIVGLPSEASALLLVVLAIVLLLSMVTTTYLSFKQGRAAVSRHPQETDGKSGIIPAGTEMVNLGNQRCEVVIGSGTFYQVAILTMENILHHLYNIRVKVECQDQSFKSKRELPMVCFKTSEDVTRDLKMRLNQALPQRDPYYVILDKLIQRLLSANGVSELLHVLNLTLKEIQEIISEHKIHKHVISGFLPQGQVGYFNTKALSNTELSVSWSVGKHGSITKDNFTEAVQELLSLLREEQRQPSAEEYLALQIAYHQIGTGKVSCQLKQNAPFLGTPGFRKHTQSYMSLTDPGDGHVMGTTRRNDWMKGAIIHVEHLERPNHHPRMKIESYRIPSLVDFCKVRLHVGDTAPTTSFMGRRVKDSDDGDFDRDLVKIAHLTSASCSAMFANGAAECKIAMEGLKTSEAVRYMQAMKGQVLKTNKQYLSAAWNLNQTILDDFQTEKPKLLDDRISIAKRAIEITCHGGFEKVTWDGASDTYPSECIMYQLSEETALSIVHEAHERGLLTYFSSGFRFAQIPLAIYSGVDGVGIGGAQVLRYMDKETGMHGPYMEENISKILSTRDEAAASTRGRGVHLLCRLDTMYFEGSLTKNEDVTRQKLFQALVKKDEIAIEQYLKYMKNIQNLPDDGEIPLVGTANRLINSPEPMLKMAAPGDNVWNFFMERLVKYSRDKNEDLLQEEYVSNPWRKMRKTYHSDICRMVAKQTACLIKTKHFT